MTALAGLRIVDFSRFLPGAYASWVAADMGADVIRIEHPRELAKQQAMFGATADPAAAARKRARPSYTRGKRSLLLNPGNTAARGVLEQLIDQADVLLEDYRPGVMAAMGLGAEAMLARNPRLIYLSLSFAGQSGPLADRAGHDPAALALAGVLSRLNGQQTPSLPGLQVADVLAGSHATIAMLLALQARNASGRGQHVDVAMSDAAMALLLVGMGRHETDEQWPKPGAWHPKGGVWECQDGDFLCTTDMEPAYWARFCTAVQRPHYADALGDPARHPAIEADLAALFRTRPRAHWLAVLDAAGTQAMPVLSPGEALDHPHARARGMVLEVPVEGQDPVRQLALPFHLAATPPVTPRAAGMPGADSAAILAELGLDSSAVAALEQAGAFSAERQPR